MGKVTHLTFWIEMQQQEADKHSLIYYQKPCIGSERGVRSSPPIQLLFPGGAFGLGVPIKTAAEQPINIDERDRNFAVLASGPERTASDLIPLRGLQVTFLVLAAFNLIITSELYFDADAVDTSKVVAPSTAKLGIFDSVSRDRRSIEDVSYAFTIIVLVLGCTSVSFESALGVSAYCLAVLLNFMLGTSALPYFVYSFRYIFDLVMLYVALVIRTRLTYTFLPLQMRLHPPALV